MKKRVLLKELENMGCIFIRHGGKHDLMNQQKNHVDPACPVECEAYSSGVKPEARLTGAKPISPGSKKKNKIESIPIGFYCETGNGNL